MSTMIPGALAKDLDAIAAGRWTAIAAGARGARARLVQEWLSLNGHAVAVDNAFGDATEIAVRAFQAAQGLDPSGAVDGATYRALVKPMLDALAAIAPAPASLADAVVACARQHLAQHPREVGGENCGPWVRLYMAGKDGKDWPWCAGFVTFILRQAADAAGRSMPIKGSVSCDSLAAQGKEKGLFVGEGSAAGAPAPGWLFLNRRTATDWTHTGLVTGAADGAFTTIEGNTNDEGSREGYEVCARTRGFAGKDFVRIA